VAARGSCLEILRITIKRLRPGANDNGVAGWIRVNFSRRSFSNMRQVCPVRRLARWRMEGFAGSCG